MAGRSRKRAYKLLPQPTTNAPGKRFVMLGHSWIEITQDRDSLALVVNGSPVVDQQGEPIGMFLDKKGGFITRTRPVTSFNRFEAIGLLGSRNQGIC